MQMRTTLQKGSGQLTRRWVDAIAWLAAALMAAPASARQAAPPRLPDGPTRLPSQDAVATLVDAYVEPYLAMHAFSGTILIARKGTVLVSRGYGMASIAEGVPASASTRYGVGSITKTITAAAVQLLAKEGRLSLNDPVSKHIPGFSHGDSITITDLLVHSSGLRDYYGWSAYASGRDEPISRDAFLRQAQAEPLDFAPGTRSGYSNTGYFVLASIIERASGQSYEAFIRERFFVPLGMEQTGELRDGTPVDGLAVGYDAGFPPAHLQPAAAVSRTWLEGSGSVYSSAPDLYRWLEATRRHTLVNVDTSPQPYGWGRRTRSGREMIEQNGRIPQGYTSYAGLYPADDLIIIVLSNIQADVTERMGTDLAAIALGAPWELPTLRPGPSILPDSASSEYAGRYEISTDFVLTVRAAGEGLVLAGPDGAFLPLDYEAPDHFFFRTLYVPIRFERDSSDHITALDWNGQIRARRVSVR
jgi:CubicO group peptidase (beta-lactamase class C family)